jgi:scyllo-inositol 2-dehydrogenase (NADP+)
MSKQINTAFASFGMSGLVFHGPLLSIHNGFHIHKILERSKNLSKSRYPEATVVRNFDDLLTDDIELVIVNTPDHTHYEYTKKALEAGKHVVVEKPFVQNTELGKELIDLADKKGLVLTVFQNRRWDGDFMTVRKVIESKMLGKLVEYEAHFDRYRNFIQPDTWKEDPGTGTGILFNLGSHMIDQAVVLFGKPAFVSADIRHMRPGSKVDDYYDINLFYDDVKVKVKSSYLVREEGPRYILHGTEGSFLKWGIDPQEAALKKGGLPTDEGWGVEDEEDWGVLNTGLDGLHMEGRIETLTGDYSRFYKNVYETICNGAELAVKPKESLLGVEIINAAFESNKAGKRIQIMGM